MPYPAVMADADIAALIEAEPFGLGSARHVFAIKDDPDCVVKKSIQARPSSNMLEWTIWLAAKNHPDLAKVLGACHCLSESGQYLIMERLDDIAPDDWLLVPEVPEWLNDRKPSAFGKSNGVVKIRDYGMVTHDQLLNRTLTHPPAFALNVQLAARLKR